MVKSKKWVQYEVERLIDRREVNGQLQYRVRWKGYEASEDTWEPLEHLQAILPMVDVFDAHWKAQQGKEEAKTENKPPTAIRKGPKVSELASRPQGHLDTDEINSIVEILTHGDRTFFCEVEYKPRRTGETLLNSFERLDVLRYRSPQLVIDLLVSKITVGRQ